MKIDITPEEVIAIFAAWLKTPEPSVVASSPFSGPVMKMVQSAFDGIMREIGSKPPELGGWLLGPVGERLVTHFVLDTSGVCSPTKWVFGAQDANRMLREYVPLRVDMKGFVHSHPSGITSLSSQDLKAFRRPFDNRKNVGLTEVLAPIVVDGKIYPYILYREAVKPVLAQIVIC